MQFLSFLSFLGVVVFVGFSNISRADVWQERPVEQYDDYDRNTDPEVIIRNENGDNYNFEEIDGDVIINQYGGNGWTNGGWQQRYPQQQGYFYPICRMYRLPNPWLFDVWIGNRIAVRDNYYRASQYFWWLVNTGQCRPG